MQREQEVAMFFGEGGRGLATPLEARLRSSDRRSGHNRGEKCSKEVGNGRQKVAKIFSPIIINLPYLPP